ncbi:MAG: hypothetical protein WDO74_06870 [Pseudomonadota bacterium]
MVVAVRVGFVGVAALCLLMTGARRAGAASAERTFHVEYEAGAACPGEAWFAEAVSRRAAGAQRVAEAEAAIRFRVELRVGTSALWVILDEGQSRREFSGDSCADVAEAMVVVAAMVVEAAPADRLTTSDGVVSQTTPAAVSPAAPAAIVAPPPAAAPSPPAAPPAAPTPRPENVAKPARWLFAVGAGLTTETAVASAPPFGGVAGVELSWRRERRWGFASHLEALATLPRTENGNVGDAELRLAAGRGSICGVRSFAAFDLQPCLTLDVGALRAIGSGDQVSNATERVMPWVAGGVALRTEYWLARSVALDAVLGARLLQRHDNFYLRPGSSVYRVPVGSFGLQIGVKIAIF